MKLLFEKTKPLAETSLSIHSFDLVDQKKKKNPYRLIFLFKNSNMQQASINPIEWLPNSSLQKQQILLNSIWPKMLILFSPNAGLNKIASAHGFVIIKAEI